MFYNNRSLINPSSIHDNRYFSLPINSHQKMKCKYQTPLKLTSTNFTRNDTLSFNTLLSKNKQTIRTNKTNAKKQSIFSNKDQKKSKNSKSKSQSIYSKKSKNSSKSKTKMIKKPQNMVKESQKQKAITNTQFYRSARGQSGSSDATFSYMSKISKIFDLACQNQPLPLQIQSFLYKPLTNLREKLRKDKHKRIGQNLITFKNDCMHVYRTTSNKEIVLFLRTNLPQNNRWQPSPKLKHSCLQNQRQLREKYFKSLKMKGHDQRPDDIFQLKRIQDRLDAFLERSLKNRKVYI